MAKNALDWIALVLVIIGAINWGLEAVGYNLVELLFSSWPIVVSVIYWLVAIAGLYTIYYVIKK